MYKQIEEYPIEGKPLGRHVNHDPRSRAYAIKPHASVSVSKTWNLRIPKLNQLSLGSCVGNGTVHQLGCDPIYDTLASLIAKGLTLDEAFAVVLYSDATHLDPYDGEYPPTDTGSDGLSGAKAAQAHGLINGYIHALSLDAMVTAMQTGAIMVGVNWYDSFDRPDSNGYVEISPNAQVRGGHEFCVRVVDVPGQMFRAVQSWGLNWGKNGEFIFNYATMDRLFHEDGDATQFVPLSVAPPTPSPVADELDRVFVSKATLCTRLSRPYKTWKKAKGI